MNDFTSGFWGIFIAAVTLLGIAWCLWLLVSQRKWLKITKEGDVGDTGHVWDGDLRELNNPVPRWWTIMYILMCVFGLGYLFLFPGLGSYSGVLGYTTEQELEQRSQAYAESVRPTYAKFDGISVEQLAKNPEAQQIGQRLFLNYCAQCHGSDARGSVSFPNLVDGDSLYPRTPEAITETISKGRNGIMPSFNGVIDGATATDIAQYVRSLSGLAHNQLAAIRGKRAFDTNCVACHGVDGKGNKMLGAPNLTDGVWLYGSSERRIVEAIMNGLNNRMPAQEAILSPEQIRMLTAWVWGLTHRDGAAVVSTAQ